MYEKLHMDVLLVPIIEKYKKDWLKVKIFTVFWAKLVSFTLCFCYDLAHSAAECAHFLAVVTSLAT